MADYLFTRPDGSACTVELPLGTAPGFGETMEHGGETLKRVVTAPHLAVEQEIKGPCVQHAPWTPGFKNYTKEGYPIASNRREQREGAKRAGREVME